jgi:hypothetical protein
MPGPPILSACACFGMSSRAIFNMEHARGGVSILPDGSYKCDICASVYW